MGYTRANKEKAVETGLMGGANNAYIRGALLLLLGRCHVIVTP